VALISAREELNDGYSRLLPIRELDGAALRTAKSIFDNYKERGVIVYGCFEDMSWTLSNETRTVGLTLLTFEGGANKTAMSWIGCTYHKFITCVKAYILFNLGDMDLTTLQEITRSFNRLAVSESECAADLLKHGRHIICLLQLIPGGNERRDTVIEELEEKMEHKLFLKNKGKQRQLADFKSYLNFHEVLSCFWLDADERQKLFYFPLYFWWNLTAILPLRPMEFLLMPRDCLYTRNGEQVITVRRTKLKGGVEKFGYRVNDDYDLHEYTINEPLAVDLQVYLSKTNHMRPTELNTLLVQEPHINYLGYKGFNASRYYTYANLCTCKRYFYKEVINIQQADINEIRLGDTRHLAMTNLILSGGSPVICRELAGHANIDISSHYYSNISNLVECLTIDRFHKKKGGESQINGKARYAASKPIDARRVGDGWCTSPVYKGGGIEDCLNVSNSDGHVGVCRHCWHLVPDNPGIMVDFKNDGAAKERLDADSRYLINMIELVRKGLGHTEDIRAVLLRLQHSGDHYSKCLWEKYLTEGIGQWQDQEK
jgi:hypothetical protein